MGSWDYYCALCGAGFYIYGALPTPEDIKQMQRALAEGSEVNGNYVDTAVCNERTLRWLEEMRLLGRNKKGSVGKGCYLTGLGDHQDYGYAEVDPGDHPNVPTEDQGGIYHDGKLGSSTYWDMAEYEPPAMPLPVHDKCFQMLRRIISGKEDGYIDLDVLYDAMGQRRGSNGDNDSDVPYSNSCLMLDYYELDEMSREQFWYGWSGFEPYINDPIEIPALSELVQNLPRAPAPAPEYSNTVENDLFAQMPLELLVEIFMYLPKSSIVSFLLSSRTALRASRSQWVWKKRLQLDMPWIWEIWERNDYPDDVDWHNIYGRMSLLSFPGQWKTHRNGGVVAEEEHGSDMGFDNRMIGLAGRRRIWNCCEQVRRLYQKQLLEASTQ